MNMWTAIVAIVAIVMISETYRSRYKNMARHSKQVSAGLEERLAGLEKRMANLETIVLEKNKADQFADL